MTETDARTTTPGKPSKPPWRHPLRAFVVWQRGTTIRRNLLIGGAVIGVGFRLVFDQQAELDRRARARDAASAVRAAYDLCVESVEASSNNRGQWAIAVAKLQELGGTEFAQDLIEGPLLSSPPRTLQECEDLLKAPVGDAG
jgi:hypothetical protein